MSKNNECFGVDIEEKDNFWIDNPDENKDALLLLMVTVPKVKENKKLNFLFIFQNKLLNLP